MADEPKKSAGQLAYEADVVARPTYFDGKERTEWRDLSETARWTWEVFNLPDAYEAENSNG